MCHCCLHARATICRAAAAAAAATMRVVKGQVKKNQNHRLEQATFLLSLLSAATETVHIQKAKAVNAKLRSA